MARDYITLNLRDCCLRTKRQTDAPSTSIEKSTMRSLLDSRDVSREPKCADSAKNCVLFPPNHAVGLAGPALAGFNRVKPEPGRTSRHYQGSARLFPYNGSICHQRIQYRGESGNRFPLGSQPDAIDLPPLPFAMPREQGRPPNVHHARSLNRAATDTYGRTVNRTDHRSHELYVDFFPGWVAPYFRNPIGACNLRCRESKRNSVNRVLP
jgi:hypothetical protein